MLGDWGVTELSVEDGPDGGKRAIGAAKGAYQSHQKGTEVLSLGPKPARMSPLDVGNQIRQQYAIDAREGLTANMMQRGVAPRAVECRGKPEKEG